MTTILPGMIVIENEKPQQCDLCGVIAELRPYGPNGECICYDCGEKNPEVTQKMMTRAISKAFEVLNPNRN